MENIIKTSSRDFIVFSFYQIYSTKHQFLAEGKQELQNKNFFPHLNV